MANSWLEQQRQRNEMTRLAEKETWIQFIGEMFQISLNESDVMGKDVLGRKRIEKVLAAVQKNYDYYLPALKKGPEGDRRRQRLDERMAKIHGPEMDGFSIRYPWIETETYKKRKK